MMTEALRHEGDGLISGMCFGMVGNNDMFKEHFGNISGWAHAEA